jgi:hypothetical protein
VKQAEVRSVPACACACFCVFVSEVLLYRFAHLSQCRGEERREAQNTKKK